MAAPAVAAIPEAPASASAARHESTRRTKFAGRSDRERDRKRGTRRKRNGEEDSTGGTERRYRTSKIGRRRKRRAEKREGRKEGRTRASRRSGRRTHRSQAGQARNPSLSPSFSFDPRPRFLRAPRASHSRSSSFTYTPARARAALSSSLSTGRHQNPPLHSSRHREPRAAHHLLPRPHPPFLTPLPPVPPQAALLAVTTRSPPPDKDKLRCIFRAPKSSNVLHRLTPVPSYATSVLDPRLYLLPRNSPPTSPNHPHATFLVPAQTTPDQLLRPPRLRYVGHQMGAQPLRTPWESVLSKSDKPTLPTLCQLPRVLFFPRLLLSHLLPLSFPAVERACWLRMIIVDKPAMTS